MSDPLGLINNTGGAGVNPTPIKPPGGAASGPSFKDVLLEQIEQVNRLQQDAARAIEESKDGSPADLFNAMTAQRKSEMAFQMLVQVRNKMLEAYEEIKQMRV